MKKGILFLAIISIALTSCRKETTITYIYENHSGYDIVIERFQGGKIDHISIHDKNDYISIYIEPAYGKPTQRELFGGSSKVNIIFSDSRILTWHNTFPYEGLYYGGNYREVKIDNHNYELYFTFTPEMYDEAVSIEEIEE